MYGEKGKIGWNMPSVNTFVEPEFNRMAPEGISVYSTRVLNDTGSTEDLRKMNDNLERAAIELKSAKVDVMAYACTAGSFLDGIEGEIWAVLIYQLSTLFSDWRKNLKYQLYQVI